MTTEAILAIDAGTSGVTALLVDHDGAVVARGYREITQRYPQPGWVEHDVNEIWRAVLLSAGEALAQAPAYALIAVGVANQRETLAVWDRRTGEPLYPAIVWQCRRSESICQELRAQGLEPEIARKTGLRLDPYFSGTKALWLVREHPELAPRIAIGDVCFGTIDTWLAWQLSGGSSYVTDVTNASRTLLYDVDRRDWDDGLLATFGLNRRVVPEVAPSGAVHGTTAAAGLPSGLPIAALVGDQQAALFGQACFEAGATKATYGTGCFVLMATGEKRIDSGSGLLTTLAASVREEAPQYALEGSIFIAGAALQWCRDNLHLIDDLSQGEALADAVEDSGGVVFVPAFVGLGSPYWGPDVRGAMYGLTGATRPAHILRAAIDSMAFQAQDVLDVMVRETGLPLRELRVDGGAAANDRLMQLQADIAGAALTRAESVESTGLGAAFIAGLTVGFWRDRTEIAALRRESRRFEMSSRQAQSRSEHERWKTTIAQLLGR